jgi:hypothetical protein
MMGKEYGDERVEVTDAVWENGSDATGGFFGREWESHETIQSCSSME